MKPRAVEPKNPELLVLYDAGSDCWDEIRVPLPEGLREGRLEFISPGLEARGWVLSLLRTSARLLSVGTMGASWEDFDIAAGVQLWIPGDVFVPEGAVVEVAFAEEGS